jgi:hypothetical protein
MAETEAPGRVRGLDEDAREQLVERGERRRRAKPCDRAGDIDVERVAGDGSRVEQGTARRRQARQLVGEGGLHGRRNPRASRGPRRPVRPAAPRADELLEVERVAPALAHERRPFARARGIADQLAGLPLVQRGEVEAFAWSLPRGGGDRGAQELGGLVSAVGERDCADAPRAPA